MPEHRGFASLLWSHSHTQCFTHTPWHSTAVTPFLAFQQSSAVEALSRGLHKLGLCFYPGQNSRSLYYNLPADWSDGCASTAAVQGTLEQGSHLTLPAEICSGFCGLRNNCVCFQQEGSVFPSLLQRVSLNECLFTSSLSLSWFLAGCPPAPSPPTSTLAHFFHSFLSIPSSANSHFSPFAPPSIGVGSIPAPIVSQQGDSPPLDSPEQHLRKCCCLLGSRDNILLFIFILYFYHLDALVTWMHFISKLKYICIICMQPVSWIWKTTTFL